MANAARLALAARRNEVARLTIAVTGIDLTGVNMAMQVRLRPDTPGAPQFALATVSTLAAEGIKLDSVTVSGGVPTSIIKVRINASTMTDDAKVPYSGEVGDNSCLAYAMQWTLNGDAQTRIYGDFIVVASAFGSDGAPTSRPVSYAGPQPVDVGGTASLTFGDQIIIASVADADLLAPLVAAAQAAQAAAERGGILLLDASGAGNNVNLSVDTGSLSNDHLYRFASPITNTGTLTINGRPVFGPGDAAIATPGTVKAGGEVIVAWKTSGQIFRFVSSANTRIDDVTSLLNSLDVSGLRADVTLTRDPLSKAIEINRNTFGLNTYSDGVKTKADVPIVLLEAGNSHDLAQGASSIDFTPVSQLATKLRARLPGRTVQVDRVAAPGSWAAQIISQLTPYRAANPSRAIQFVGFCTVANDAIANIFQAYQGFVGPNNTAGGYEAQLESVIQYIQDTLNSTAIVVIDHYPHPFRSRDNGRLTVTPESWMQYPIPALLGGYLNMVFSASTDRITALAGTTPFDLFRQYGSGLLGPGQFLCQFRPDGFVGKLYKIATISTDGSYANIEGTYAIVNGAVVKQSDGVDTDLDDGVTQVRQCNFDNETQVVPPFSQCLVQRDLGSGTPVTVSWRHFEIVELARRVAARNGAVVVDWAAVQGRLLTSDAVYDEQFPPDVNGFLDDFHLPDAGYLLLDGPMDRLASDIASGRQIKGNVYD